MKSTPKIPVPGEIIFGEGAFYLNLGEVDEIEVGAVGESGGSFKVEREITDSAFMGKKGPVKGLRRKRTAIPVMTINVMQVTSEKLLKCYAGLDADTVTKPGYAIITGRQLALGDYLKNVAFVGETQDGREVVVKVKNALGDGNIEWNFDSKEIENPVQFTGHYDPAVPEEEPWEIEIELPV